MSTRQDYIESLERMSSKCHNNRSLYLMFIDEINKQKDIYKHEDLMENKFTEDMNHIDPLGQG